MSSPPGEEGRGTDEDPQRPITIFYPLAVGRYAVTRGEFARFVRETGWRVEPSCSHPNVKDNDLDARPAESWNNIPGQTDRHPVVCVSWEDARAYTAWLSKRTGHSYRLLSEAEWEYLARAGTTSPRYWAADPSRQCKYANGADLSGEARHPEWGKDFARCSDGFPETSPVGRFKPNAFGLYDMLGNVDQFVEDCYQPDYAGVPTDGRPIEACSPRSRGVRIVARGGDWTMRPAWLRASGRDVEKMTSRVDTIGFRVAREEAAESHR